MSHSNIGLCSCPEIQERLNTHFTNCDPTLLTPMAEVGLVNFLNSPINKKDFLSSTISPGRGKKRTVELSYTPRILTTEVDDTCNDRCTSNNSQGLLCETYTMPDQCLSQDWFITLAEMADICIDNDTWLEERIKANMNAIIRRLDVEYATRLTALTGAFANGESDVVANVKTITTKLSGGAFDDAGIVDVEFATQNAGYCGTPFTIGWGEAYKYWIRKNAGCCADDGVDIGELARQNSSVFIKDKNIEAAAAFGSNHFITLDQGAVQPVFWNQFEGAAANVADDDSFKQSVLVDPEFGIPFDFIATKDCKGTGTAWNFQLKVQWELFGLPDETFFDGDPLDNVKFANDYVITNP